MEAIFGSPRTEIGRKRAFAVLREPETATGARSRFSENRDVMFSSLCGSRRTCRGRQRRLWFSELIATYSLSSRTSTSSMPVSSTGSRDAPGHQLDTEPMSHGHGDPDTSTTPAEVPSALDARRAAPWFMAWTALCLVETDEITPGFRSQSSCHCSRAIPGQAS